MPVRFTLIAFALLTLAAACGKNGEAEPGGEPAGDTASPATPTPEPVPVFDDITGEQLAIMVLPLDEFGDAYADFNVDEDSGVRDNDEATGDTLNPDDTGDDLAAMGRLTGYELEYQSPDLFDLNSSIFGVSSSVDQFRDADAASAYIDYVLADAQAYIGQDVDGVTVVSMDTFDVPGIGDEAVGFAFEMSFSGDQSLYGAQVGFRTGPLLGAVSIGYTEPEDHSAELITWATLLAERVTAVASGALLEEPVPVPTPEGAAGRPDEPPFPDNMVLALDDVAGATVQSEGYFQDHGMPKFTREFELAAGSIENSVILYPDAREAETEVSLQQLRTVSDSYLEELSLSIAARFGGDADDVEIEALDLAAGDQSASFHMRLHTDLAEYTIVFAYIRQGRAIGELEFVFIGVEDPEMVQSLAVRLAERMDAELAATP